MERSNGKCITEEYAWEKWHGDTEARIQLFGQKALAFRGYFFEQTRKLKQEIIEANDFQAETSLPTQLRIEISAEKRLLNDRCLPIRRLGRALNDLVLPKPNYNDPLLFSTTTSTFREDDNEEEEERDEEVNGDGDDEDLARLNNEEWHLREWKPSEIDSAVEVLLGHIRGSSQEKTRRVATQLLVHLMRQHEAAMSAMERAMGLFVSKAFSRAKPQQRPAESRSVLHLLGTVSDMMAERISSLGTCKKLCRMLTRKALLAITFLQAHCRYFLFRCKRHPSDVRRRLRHLHRTSIAAVGDEFRRYKGVDAHYIHYTDVVAQLQLFSNLVNPDVSPFCHRDRESAVGIGAHWALMDLATCASLRMRRLAAEGLIHLCQVKASRRELLEAGVHRVAVLMLQSQYRLDVELGMKMLHHLADGIAIEIENETEEDVEDETKKESFARLLCNRGRDGGVVRWLLRLVQSCIESLRRSVFDLVLKLCLCDPLLLLGYNERPTLQEQRLVAAVNLDASKGSVVKSLDVYRSHRTHLFLRALLAAVQQPACGDGGIVVCALKIFCHLCSSEEARKILLTHEVGKRIMQRYKADPTLIQISRAAVMMMYLHQNTEPSPFKGVGEPEVQALVEDSSVPDIAHDLLLRLTLPGPNGRCYVADYLDQDDAIYCCLAFAQAFMQSEMNLAHMTSASAFVCKLAVMRRELLTRAALKTDQLLLKISVRCMRKAISLTDLPKSIDGAAQVQSALRVTLSNVHSCFVALCHLVRPDSALLASSSIHPTAALFLSGGSEAPWRSVLAFLRQLPRISNLLVKGADKKVSHASCAAAIRFLGEILPWRGVQEELFCDFAEYTQQSSQLEAKVDYLVYPKSSGRLHDGSLGEMIEHALPVLLDTLRQSQPISVRTAALVAVARISFNRTAAARVFSCLHEEEKKRWFLEPEETALRKSAPKGLFTLVASMARTWQIRESLLHSVIPEAAFFALNHRARTGTVGEIALLFARLMNVGSLSVSSLNQRLLADERNSLRLLSQLMAMRGDLRAQLSALVAVVQFCKDIVNAAMALLSAGCLDAVCQILAHAGSSEQEQEHISIPDALVLQQGLRVLLALLHYPSLLLNKAAIQSLSRRLESVHRVLSSSESEQATELRHLINEAADLLEQHKNRTAPDHLLRESESERNKPGGCVKVKSQDEGDATTRRDLLWTRPRSKKPRRKRAPKSLPRIKSRAAELREEKELFVDPVFCAKPRE